MVALGGIKEEFCLLFWNTVSPKGSNIRVKILIHSPTRINANFVDFYPGQTARKLFAKLHMLQFSVLRTQILSNKQIAEM